MLATEKKNGIIFYITKTLLIISIALSLFLSGILCFRVIVDPNFKIDLNHIYLIGILFVTGILGDQLSDILSKVIRDKIDQYVKGEDWKKIVENNIGEHSESLKKGLNSVFNEAYKRLEGELKELYKLIDKAKVGIEEELKEETSSDTVIVPASWSMLGNKKFKIYFCQKDRTFSSAKYIALYGDKIIQCIGQRQLLSQEELNKKIQDSSLKKWLVEEMGITPDINYLDFYDISNDYRELQIEHKKDGPLVRKQIYSSFEKLNTAKTTEEI